MKEKILDWESLREKVEHAKMSGKKTVFTNGCFDLIHAGHIKYLREAKGLGDVLVVAINSDRSVASIKSGRPIIPETQRAEVVSALEMVDYVTIFDQETPYEIIRLLRPDILVKGGDWEKGDIVGSDIVPETHSLPYVEGISTTSIIERIKGLKA